MDLSALTDLNCCNGGESVEMYVDSAADAIEILMYANFMPITSWYRQTCNECFYFALVSASSELSFSHIFRGFLTADSISDFQRKAALF